MSDTPESEPTTKVYRLTLGRGERSITAQGEGAAAINPYIVSRPGAQRLIVYRDGKLHGDFEIDGQNVRETSISVVDLYELAPDRLPWPEEPWKIGAHGWRSSALTLCIPPEAFHPLWEIAEAPKNEQFDVGLQCLVTPTGFFVYEVSLRGVHRPTHPVVFEVRKLGQDFAQALPMLGWFFAAVILATSIVQWLLR